jgi:hypothetical protein
MWARGRVIVFVLYALIFGAVMAYTCWMGEQVIVRALESGEGRSSAVAAFHLQGMLRSLWPLSLIPPAFLVWHFIDYAGLGGTGRFTFAITTLFILAALLSVLAFLFYAAGIGARVQPSTDAASVVIGAGATVLSLAASIWWMLASSGRAGRILREREA